MSTIEKDQAAWRRYVLSPENSTEREAAAAELAAQESEARVAYSERQLAELGYYPYDTRIAWQDGRQEGSQWIPVGEPRLVDKREINWAYVPRQVLPAAEMHRIAMQAADDYSRKIELCQQRFRADQALHACLRAAALCAQQMRVDQEKETD